MKRVRIICLIMALIMVVPAFAACGEKKIAANVTVIFREPKDDTLTDKEIAAMIKGGTKEEDIYEELLNFETKVEGTEKKWPNVLQAAEEVLTHFEKDYNVSKDGTYIAEAFGRKQVDTLDKDNGYYSYWACTINGDVSKEGRQSVTKLYDQDVIVFTWTSSSEPRQDTGAAETTDPNDDITSEIPMDETEAPEEEEDNNA